MFCKALLTNGEHIEELQVEKYKYFSLPRLSLDNASFLGWSRYSKLNYGYMNFCLSEDAPIYAISTEGPAYIIESHYRGDRYNYDGPRSQFRRYIVDIYLENAKGRSGSLNLETPNNFLYYLGCIPVSGTELKVNADTNERGHAYNGYAQFTTSAVEINWESAEEIDSLPSRVKIASLVFAFGRYGTGYAEIERRTSDDIVCPAWDKKAFVGQQAALVSANFYNGTVPENTFESIEADKNVLVLNSEETLEKIDKGKFLSRFAVLADSHIGIRYEWKNYDWLYGVYEHLAKIHSKTPLSFVMQLGDNIDDGYENSYERDYEIYLETFKRLAICDADNPIESVAEGKIPNYELQGNHDTSMKTRFFRNRLWYAENAEGDKTAFIAFFVKYGGYPAVLNTVKGDYGAYRSYGIIDDANVKFIEESIIEAGKAGAKHIVLCSHFGIAGNLNAPVLPESGFGKIENLCEKYNIKLYFSGHEHNKDYALCKCRALYNYDAAMTHDAYAVVELYEKAAVTKIYNTANNSLERIDVINLIGVNK